MARPTNFIAPMPRDFFLLFFAFLPFARSTISVLDQHAPWCVHNVSTYVLEDQAIEDADITNAVCKKKR